jgi:TonB family protein
MVILVHATLLSVKGTQHIKVVDIHAKVQHITLARMAVKQPAVQKSLPMVEKKMPVQEKRQIKPRKLPKKVITKAKKIVKISVKKKKIVRKKKHIDKKRKYAPKQKKQKVYATKESMVTLKDKYINQIRTQIRKKLIYPTVAKRMRMEDVVYVSFTVYKNGHIGNIQVKKGHKSILKKSAVKTLEKIVIKAIPAQLGLTKLELNLPISFKIMRG